MQKFLYAPRNERRINCPYCNEGSYKCYINTKLGLFYCFHCGKGGKLQWEDIEDLNRLVLKETEERQQEIINWKENFLPINKCSSVIKNYLISRIGEEKAYKFPFGEIRIKDYLGRLAIPIDNFSYFQARSIKKEYPKYLNPFNNMGIKKKSEVIWGLEYLNFLLPVTICEGVFSAIAIPLSYQGIAILGKFLSNIQLERIKNLPNKKIIVCLDAGAEEEGWKMAQQLLPYKNTYVVFLEKGDPDENKKKIRELLKKAKRITLKTIITVSCYTQNLVL